MDIYHLIETKRDEILQIAAKHGAGNVRLIGSVARREANSESDLDLLVKMELGRTLLDHASLILELEKLLGCKVDVASDGGLKERYKEDVLRDAIAI